MRREEGTYKNASSLRYCVTSFDTFGFRQTEEEKTFLRELLLRNEITHDYFNRELHQSASPVTWMCGKFFATSISRLLSTSGSSSAITIVKFIGHPSR